jgi:hypothetical protein
MDVIPMSIKEVVSPVGTLLELLFVCGFSRIAYFLAN